MRRSGKLLALLLLVLGLCTARAEAQTFDGSGSGSFSATNTVTVSVTVSGSNRALICSVSPDDASTFTSPSGTYNGVSMGAAVVNSTTGFASSMLFITTAPSTGTNNFVATWTGNATGNAVCVSYTNVDQATPNDALQNFGTFNDPADAVTTTAGDVLLCILNTGGSSTSAAPGTGVTERVENDTNRVHAIGEMTASGASTTCGWTVTGGGGQRYQQRAVILNAAGGGAAAPVRCMLMGVCP